MIRCKPGNVRKLRIKIGKGVRGPKEGGAWPWERNARWKLHSTTDSGLASSGFDWGPAPQRLLGDTCPVDILLKGEGEPQ